MQNSADTRTILERLVAFPTVSRESNLPLLDWVTEFLEDRGFVCHRVPDPTGMKAGLFASLGPDRPGGVMLSAHSDVVPVDGQDCKSDPFTLTERDGRLHGRGAVDMKGFLACALRAADLAANSRLAEPFKLALSYDEEIGCVGIAEMIGHLPETVGLPDLCIVGEPTEMSLVTGHKGKQTLRARCHGQAGHSSNAPGFMNALHLAGDLLWAIRDTQEKVRQTGMRDACYTVPYSTLHVGRLEGGVALNIVPESAVLDFELRHLGHEAPEPILGRIREAAERIVAEARAEYPEAAIEIATVSAYPALETDPAGPGVRRMMDLLDVTEARKVSFGTEAGVFAAAGVESVVCGPGSISVAHQPDEFITLDQLAACDRFLARLLDTMTAD